MDNKENQSRLSPPDFAPDAVLKCVKNLKVGMRTQERGEVLGIESHEDGSWYWVQFDQADGSGNFSRAFPPTMLMTVWVPSWDDFVRSDVPISTGEKIANG